MQRKLMGVVFFGLLLLAAGLQLQAARVATRAQQLYVASGATSRPLSARLVDARSAAELRPDVVAYYQRAASLQAKRYADAGALKRARALLILAWGRDRSAVYLRRQLREVNMAIFANDSRKAHVLHGREKPGGVLEPGDLLP